MEELSQMIKNSNRIVFFGGAGVSTESGIPDFRSVDGLYQEQYEYPPEEILSKTFYHRNTKEFYRFYRNKMVFLDVKPNACHTYLAQLEHQGKLLAVITQNIDGLHQKAGSQRVLELHGSIHRNFCQRCHKSYPLEYMLGEGLPTCSCGGGIKPDVVLYEESLNPDTIDATRAAIEQADMLIIGGTSLTVYPAASFIRFYHGNRLVVINKSPIPVSADLVLDAPIGEVFEQLAQERT